ncbi:MAG: electron transfer flavoprotein subunit alpha [Desulfatiglandales bacterium]
MSKNSKGIDVAEIIPDKCIACQLCIGTCPVGAIQLSEEGVARVDPELCVGCGQCFEVCPVEAVSFERKKRKKISKKERGAEAVEGVAYEGVAVFIEIVEGSAAPVSLELIGKARDLAMKRNSKVIGFLLGKDVEGIADEAVLHGCDEIHMVSHPDLETYLSRPHGKILANLCREVCPEILLMGATHLGRDLSGVVATRLGTGLTADCTGLDIEEETGLLLMTRPTFGGNIMATIFCENRRPQMSTVRPKVMKMHGRDTSRKGNVFRHEWIPVKDALAQVVRFTPDAKASEERDITDYPALVTAGKGACDEAALPMLQELAGLLDGTLACTRPVVEAGLMPYERQVGQTGKTVAPKLYIAVGVSGAVQHLVAIQGAEKILAINSDENASIFQVADVGIIGDYRKIVPELIRQLKRKMKRS